MSKTITPSEAVEVINWFTNNLMEYIENITGSDYPNDEGQGAIEFISGYKEEEFWDALKVLKTAAGVKTKRKK